MAEGRLPSVKKWEGGGNEKTDKLWNAFQIDRTSMIALTKGTFANKAFEEPVDVHTYSVVPD